MLLGRTREVSYLPVICAGVDEDRDPTIEKVGDIVLSRGRVLVHVEVEEGTDGGGATGEIVGGSDAEEVAHGGLVEIISDDGVFFVAKVADARLMGRGQSCELEYRSNSVSHLRDIVYVPSWRSRCGVSERERVSRIQY